MLSGLRTLRATTSAVPLCARALSTTAPLARRKDLGNKDLADMPDFRWDDAPALGHLRLAALDDVRDMVAKMYTDTAALKSQARKFVPPKGAVRVTSQIDLSEPGSPYNVKRVLVAPVSALPLKGDAALTRFKLLAGPRWTPGKPGRGELGARAAGDLAAAAEADKAGEHGYVKISEERYPDGRMNRKSVSDMLERLVTAANDSKSPIPADTPVDTRHLLARQRKHRKRGAQHVWARSEALERRREVVGGVRGFPKEWLSPEAQAKLSQ